jgi:hypothetical protein
LSYLPVIAGQRLSELARDVLEQSIHGRKGRRGNVRAAAVAATRELARRTRKNQSSNQRKANRSLAIEAGFADDSDARIDANRRLLYRLAYKWRAGERMQEDGFTRALNLLGCLKKGGISIELFDPGRESAWKALHVKSDWILPPDPFEKAALLLSAEDRLDGLAARRIEREAARLLPADPLPEWALRRIESFRKRALAQGHDKWRIEAAIRRFLAPLCAHGRTSGIERGWQELSPRERRLAVKYGLEIEKIWLGTVPAYKRTWATA